MLSKEPYILIFGASYGLGESLTRYLSDIGLNILAVDRDNNFLSDQDPSNVKRLEIDIKDINWYEKLESYITSSHLKLVGMVVYAGSTSFGTIENIDEESLDSLVSVNTKLPFMLTKLFLKYCSKDSSSSIIYIGSPHQFKGDKDRAAYAYTKSPLVTLCKSIATYYYKNLVRANVLIMGWTKTEGELNLRKKQNINQAELDELASKTPLGRLISTEEYHSIIEFLLSEKSILISGSTIYATAGLFI